MFVLYFFVCALDFFLSVLLFMSVLLLLIFLLFRVVALFQSGNLEATSTGTTLFASWFCTRSSIKHTSMSLHLQICLFFSPFFFFFFFQDAVQTPAAGLQRRLDQHHLHGCVLFCCSLHVQTDGAVPKSGVVFWVRVGVYTLEGSH